MLKRGIQKMNIKKKDIKGKGEKTMAWHILGERFEILTSDETWMSSGGKRGANFLSVSLIYADDHSVVSLIRFKSKLF